MAPVTLPLEHRVPWECLTSLLGSVVAGWLRLHRVLANFNSAHRRRREATAVEAVMACRHGLPTVEARRVMNNMSYNSFCHFHN